MHAQQALQRRGASAELGRRLQALNIPDAPKSCGPALREKINWGLATSSYQVRCWGSLAPGQRGVNAHRGRGQGSGRTLGSDG